METQEIQKPEKTKSFSDKASNSINQMVKREFEAIDRISNEI